MPHHPHAASALAGFDACPVEETSVDARNAYGYLAAGFDQLLQMGKVDLLIGCLLLILFLESAFVFLPLPGDSLVLLAGGLLATGVIAPEVVYLYIPLAAGIGSMVAYWQGHALAHTRFMHHIEEDGAK